MAAYKESSKGSYGKGYGKRPLWQWILIYVIIGGIVYAGIYFFIIAKKGGYSNTYNYSTPATSSAPTYTAPTY